MWQILEGWLTGAVVLMTLCPSFLALPLQLCFAKKLIAGVGHVRYWSGLGLHMASGLAFAAAFAYLGRQCTGCASGVMLILGIPLWWALFIVGALLVLVSPKKRSDNAGEVARP